MTKPERHMLERAILFATVNDDSNTLADILHWSEDNDISRDENFCDKLSPILYASLRDYDKCVTVLYKYGYRLKLPIEDERIINDVLMRDDAVTNDHSLFSQLRSGDKHIKSFYRCLKKRTDVCLSDTDPVERLLHIKAFANPHYVATEFMEKCEGKDIKEEDFREFDPIRKSLTLARYTKFLSSFDPQYRAEYQGRVHLMSSSVTYLSIT